MNCEVPSYVLPADTIVSFLPDEIFWDGQRLIFGTTEIYDEREEDLV